MPISYNKCWKCPPLRSSQRCARRIMLANTLCQLISCPQCAECWPEALTVCVDDLNTQYPWNAPIKRSLGGLSLAIVEATISLKWGVQETQIPSKPWVAWLFEHPVWVPLYKDVRCLFVIICMQACVWHIDKFFSVWQNHLYSSDRKLSMMLLWAVNPWGLANTETFRRIRCLSLQGTCVKRLRQYVPPKGKGKAIPLHAMEALGGRGSIARTHSRPRH
jgi:hypothetical protein